MMIRYFAKIVLSLVFIAGAVILIIGALAAETVERMRMNQKRNNSIIVVLILALIWFWHSAEPVVAEWGQPTKAEQAAAERHLAVYEGMNCK